MKRLMATAAALALLAGISAANAQNVPTDTSNKGDKTMEQSQKSSQKSMSNKHAAVKKHKVRHRASTTGAGSREGAIGGPRNDPSIHQSIQRDSRGTPKGPGSDYNK